MAHLWMYTFDADERARRLSLVDRFKPGQISESLADAIYHVEEGFQTEEEIEQMAVERRRRRYPWLKWMLKWGYPPGWIAGRSES